MISEQREARFRRFYTPDRMGPYCQADCGLRVPLALANVGIVVHPTCGTARSPKTLKARQARIAKPA